MSGRARLVWAVAVLLGAALLIGGTGSSAAAAPASGRVLSLQLNGVVDPFMASYVQRGIARAAAEGDAAVLLTIDTPGGLDSSMREIVQAIGGSRVPVICYTGPTGARAASAGTFIMMACPINAMAPGTNIGAAHPVGVSGAIESAKVTNDAAAYIQALAERWNRNAAWAASAVRKATSVSVRYAVTHRVVDLEAAGAPGLLREVGDCGGGVAAPATGLLAVRGPIAGVCGAAIVPFGMSITERAFHAFANPNIAFLLLEIGFIAMIVWVIHPALHVSLAVGVIFTVLGFAILETLPVDLTGVILLVVSAVMFVLDVKAKTHGLLTAGGIVTLVLGGLLLFNPTVPSARVSLPLLLVVAAAAAAFMFTVVRSLLAARERPVVAGEEALVGAAGVALTALEPKGRVRTHGESWTAESASGRAIPSGSPVRVVGVRGVHLIVEAGGEPVPEVPAGAEPAASVPAEAGRSHEERGR